MSHGRDQRRTRREITPWDGSVRAERGGGSPFTGMQSAADLRMVLPWPPPPPYANGRHTPLAFILSYRRPWNPPFAGGTGPVPITSPGRSGLYRFLVAPVQNSR